MNRTAASPRRAALFLTCSADTLYPSAGRACVAVLEAYGVGVEFPPTQTCCGQPWLNTGNPEEARRLARHFLEVFEAADAVVAPSASCVDTVRNRYPELFAAEPGLRSRFEALAGRTWEFCEFLHRVLGVCDLPPAAAAVPVTYHSTCRTLRGVGLDGVAETYLRQLYGDAFVSLPNSDTCCGFGGSFSVKLPEISGRLLRDKLDAVAATGATLVTALDLSCLTHLAGGAKRLGLNHLRFAHLAELIAEAVAGDRR
ncbi:MAG: (Fe-S)-binding protein [Deferrisomatales bacterium]|nr:(Fe-S)-binding protein [Deferrisomatales bacterium]